MCGAGRAVGAPARIAARPCVGTPGGFLSQGGITSAPTTPVGRHRRGARFPVDARLALSCAAVTHAYDPAIALRFRGFLPVVIDVETAGFDAGRDALLEIAAITLRLNAAGHLALAETAHAHIEPFSGANLDPRALAFTGIDPFHPFRMAVPENPNPDTIDYPSFRKILQTFADNLAAARLRHLIRE